MYVTLHFDVEDTVYPVEARTDDDRRARIEMTLEISDMKHLEKVMKSVKAVDGVLNVERATRTRASHLGRTG